MSLHPRVLNPLDGLQQQHVPLRSHEGPYIAKNFREVLEPTKEVVYVEVPELLYRRCKTNPYKESDY